MSSRDEYLNIILWDLQSTFIENNSYCIYDFNYINNYIRQTIGLYIAYQPFAFSHIIQFGHVISVTLTSSNPFMTVPKLNLVCR